MITKAIVDSIINPFQIKVRIPILHGIEGISASTSTSDLPLTTISCIPGISPALQKGDIIFVGFDSNDESRPIMLGFLSKANLSNYASQVSANTLIVTDQAQLPLDTSIGNIGQAQLTALIGIEGNIQERLTALEDQLRSILDIEKEGNE